MEQWARDWLEGERAKGTKRLEIKNRGPKHYVYESTTHWDSVLKKRVKTSNYKGKLDPDVVILYKAPKKDEAFDKYQAIGVPVICMDCFNQAEMDGSIKIFGELFNQRAEASALIEWYHNLNSHRAGNT